LNQSLAFGGFTFFNGNTLEIKSSGSASGNGKTISMLRSGLIGTLGTGAPAGGRPEVPGGWDGSDRSDWQNRQRVADFLTISKQCVHLL